MSYLLWPRRPLCASWIQGAAICGVLAGVVLFWHVGREYCFTPDSGYYLALGRSLAQGEGYCFGGRPHVQYPPGYPALTALVQACWGLNFLVLRCAQAAVGVGVVLLGFLYASRRLGFVGGLAVGIALAFSKDFVAASSVYLLSEPLFMLLSMGAILFGDRARGEDARTASAILCAVLAAGAALTRSVGVYSLPLLSVGLLIGGSWKHRLTRVAVFWAVFAVLVGGWSVRNRLVAPGEGGLYMRSFVAETGTDWRHPVDSLRGVAVRVVGKAGYEARSAASLVTNTPREAVPRAVVWVVAIMLGIGWLARVSVLLRRNGAERFDAADLYVAAYVGICVLWPFREDNRFLLPVLPMLLLYALSVPLALTELVRKAGERCSLSARAKAMLRILPSATAAILCVVFAAMLRGQMADVREEAKRENAIFEDVRDAFAKLPARERKSAVVFSEKPSLAALACGVRAVGGYRLDADVAFEDYLREQGCTLIETRDWDALTQEYLADLRRAHPDRLSVAAQGQWTTLLRYTTGGSREQPKESVAVGKG